RRVGGENFALIAGPCTVESREQMLDVARAVAEAGAGMLRGGAYKPRTSPYSFQGLGGEGLRLLQEAKEETGLPIVTELMDVRDLDPVLEVADVIQLGARNMQNYTLLTEVGRSGRPVLLKRGLSATLEELLMAAEYILKEGNEAVILCERGIRTFETSYRVTLVIAAVPVLKQLSHLPVIVDPIHATGRRHLAEPLSLASSAAGRVAFVAVPVGALAGAVGEALAVAGPECVVSDVGSTKRDIVATHEDPRFVGGHPLAGAETAGVEHARADLFEGATWYLTPTAATSGILYERLHRAIAEFGAGPAAIDAATHDRLLANVSHLPHVLANVLVSQAAQTLAGEN